MSFYWPHAFWLLVLPVGFAIAELARRARASSERHPKMLRAEASPSGLTLTSTTPTSSMPKVRWRLWLGLVLAVTAFARPQWGEIEEPVFEQSREILIGIDLSRSMLAPDVTPSRLERAKLLITGLLERLVGERVGLAVFAGTSFLQSPLSADYEILREFLPALGPQFLPEGGTEYAALLDTALDAFSNDEAADRYLIILSDGESQTEEWQSRVDSLRERGIRVISLGIGTAEGAMLPDGTGGFIKDERGAVVLSRLNNGTLEELARRTQGAYRDASSWVDLATLLAETVETGRAGEFTEQRRARRIERFQWSLGPAFFILLWSLWREFPVQPRQRAVTIAVPRRATAAAATSILLVFGLFAPKPLSALEAIPPPGHPAAAQSGDPAAEPPSFEGPLNALITQLSTQPTVAAREFAQLANETIQYGQQVLGTGEKPSVGTIHDALDGVDAGESLDPHAADWPQLRADLEKLLEESQEPPPQDQEQEQDEENEDESEDEGDDGDKGDQGDQGDQGDDGEPGEDGQEGEQGENGDSESETQDGEGEPSESDSENQESQDGKNQDQSEPEQRKNEHNESAFGDLDEPQEAPEPQPQPQQPDPGNQKIGGQQTQTQEAQENPELAVPLQKLDQLKQQDSPAQLFQLMQDPTAQPPLNKRDW